MKRMLLVIVATLMLGGCMVARGPQGQIVMGFDVGVMPETVSEIGGALASTFLGPQAGNLVSTGLMLLLGGGTAVAGVSMNKGRKKSDQGREKANNEVIALKGLLQGLGVLKQPAAPVVVEEPVDPS